MLDLKITDGRILDGTGAPWFHGDIGVRGDTIVAIGDLDTMTAATTIDAARQIVSPGFIDLLGWSHDSALEDPRVEAKVRQGVTTEVTGEGFSPGPSPRWPALGDFLDHLDQQGTAINFALLMGASNARRIVIGDGNRAATADELRRMEEIVAQGMRDGAIGLSTSLIYVPAMFSTTEEIIRLARVAAAHGGMYFSHIRDEGDRITEALEEAFRIGREADIPVNIWHLKTSSRPNWGRMPEVIRLIEEARAEGIDVAANIYPYPASSTNLATLAPDWGMEGGYGQLVARLNDPAQRPRITEALQRQLERRGEKGVYVARIGNPAHAAYEKRFIEEIAAMMNVPTEEALIRLYIENEGPPQAIFFSMSEDDVQYALKQPFVSIGADSSAPTAAARAEGGAVHPRAYGTFPRVLGHYARDLKLITLEDAVRKMTSQAAQRAHLLDRGILRSGMRADIVVFDPDRVRDLSQFDDPHHFSEGISHVVVNGVPVLRDGEMTDALPGKTLRGRGYVQR
ncbi:MAG TPA: D-aminoacylase [Thermoanaerobaculia bacterium]|nr:D-aminoacylase [Thermoanaerobaculia bacterium]